MGCRSREPADSVAATTEGSEMAKGSLRRFDAHVHFPPRLPRPWDAIRRATELTSALNLSGGWPGGYLEASLEAAAGRWLVAVTLPWHFSAHPRFAEACVDAVRTASRLGARALKIPKALGLSARRPDGELWAVDAPEFDAIFEAAGETGLPVFIHTADPEAFWRVNDATNPRHEELTVHPNWSYEGRDVPSFAELLASFHRRVARHAKTRFVGVHFGNHAEDPEDVERRLDDHPNLFIDVAARLPELGKHDPKIIAPIFERRRGRILFGTDFGISGKDSFMLGSTGAVPDGWDAVPAYFRASYRYLETTDTLPSMTPIQGRHALRGLGLGVDVLRAIYWDNAAALLGPLPSPPAP